MATGLRRAGISNIFTLSGNHVMPIFDAAIDAGLQLIHTRHEAAAVHMADAWARLTGEVGVALVTGGPGHANAVGALYTARMAEAPILLLSGHAPTDQAGMGAFQEMAQAEIAAPLTKASWTCSHADALAADLAKALRIARSGRPGPVHLSLPSDLLGKTVSSVGAPADLADDPKPSTLARPTAQIMLRELGNARHPLILTGPANMTRAGRRRCGRLEDATGIPVIGMESPRGIQDPALGAFADLLARADCVLLLGKRLDFTLAFGRSPAWRADCRLMQIDAEPTEIARTRQAVGPRLIHAEQADLQPSMLALVDAATRQDAHELWRADVRSAIERRPAGWDRLTSSRPGLLHPLQALRPLRAVLNADPEAVFVCDGGEFGQWAQACLDAPQRVINGVAGAIGAALPFAVAARLARPTAPVIAVMGDGTFGFHAAEIDTAVRYRLPFIAMVGNDACWNAERQIQLREFGPERQVGCDLLPTRYDEVARGFGGHGETVVDADQLPAALERARRSGLPACLNVMIDGQPAPTLRSA